MNYIKEKTLKQVMMTYYYKDYIYIIYNMNIYILKLEKGKYYVGKTKNIKRRIKQHFEGNGSYWTKIFKPIELVDIYKNCDEFDEEKYTLQYMKTYGIDNVRGGSFCQYKLSTDARSVLNKILLSDNDLCFGCGKNGHFISECMEIENDKCYGCGESGHYKRNCKNSIDNKVSQRKFKEIPNESQSIHNSKMNHLKLLEDIDELSKGKILYDFGLFLYNIGYSVYNYFL